jgi:hypothetical protein
MAKVPAVRHMDDGLFPCWGMRAVAIVMTTRRRRHQRQPPSCLVVAAFRPYWPVLLLSPIPHLSEVRDIRPMRVAPPVAIIFSICLAACTSALESQFTLFADPGKYEFHNCEQLSAQRTSRKQREQELKSLMDKAERSTGGAFVNVIAYQTEYVEAREDVKLIEATARAKKCSTPENWQSTSAFR